jgi:hypothetical protein
MVREGRPVQLLSRSTGGRLDRSLRYREILKPLGFAHELGSIFADGSAWGGMDLIRGADVPDFTASEVALVRRLAPTSARAPRPPRSAPGPTRAGATPRPQACSTSTVRVRSSP